MQSLAVVTFVIQTSLIAKTSNAYEKKAFVKCTGPRVIRLTDDFCPVFSDPTLTLSNLQRRQSGIYQCVIRNGIGMAYATARLLVVETLGPAGGGSSAGGAQASPGATVRPPAGGSGTGNRPG